MNRNYFYVILGLAAFCLLLIFFSLISDASHTTPPPKYTNFPVAPFKSYITGLGIVQAQGGNISLGGPTDRIVNEILVHAGDHVQKGQVLVEFQNQDLKAQLQGLKVSYDTALVNLKKLQSYPRKEDVQLADTAVKAAQVDYDQAKDQYDMVNGLQNNRALSLEEIKRRQFNVQLAEVKLDQAQADAEKVKQGTWKPDLDVARLQVLEAEANVQRMDAEIAKTVIRSPIDGTIIEIKTHVGEYPSYPILIVGNTQELDLKVNVNQFDSHYFNPKARAVAYLQGDPNNQVELEFIRLNPILTSKSNLTNDVKEIVDTKVLQVLYRIKNPNTRIYVGQPMDVYIEAEFEQ